MYNNDIYNELHTNFIEYAYAVNTDRAIPSAYDGLKPVAKRILFSCLIEGRKSNKPHVKAARIVGDVMGKLHPHGDSSIYGAMARLSQDWVMRYPLIDWHGNNGNIVGDGPAAARYTEARLAKIAEDGLLEGIKKDAVDFIPNYDETLEEPVVLPSIFPNLLCNPNSGIGVAMACNWAPHNLIEVAKAITDYINGDEPMLPGPDFPTGGIIINKNDIPTIFKTGHGSVKIRAKYKIEKNSIIFYEIPYGTIVETLVAQIGEVADSIKGITDIHDATNKKGVKIIVEFDKTANGDGIANQLFAKTDLQTSFSYNQVALVGKTPTELTLKDCCRIYVEHNLDCLKREKQFDLNNATDRLEIVNGLLKALEDIDNIIKLIKSSESSAKAKDELIKKYNFTENQAKAILAMRLSSLANLETIEIQNEQKELINTIANIKSWLQDSVQQLNTVKNNLQEIVKKYGDARRTELVQIDEPKTKEEKEIAVIPPEKCVVVLTEANTLKRIPAATFKAQRRGGKGIKTQEDITQAIIRTNTIDSLMIFTDKGKMYRLIVDNIPVGTNTSRGVSVKSLIEMDNDEDVSTIYSIYRETDAKYVLFVTKRGLVKKTSLKEYVDTKKAKGIGAINIKDGDELAAVTLLKEEQILLLTKNGRVIRFNSTDVSATGRLTAGVKGIELDDNDEVINVLPIREATDMLGIFTKDGKGKKMKLSEITLQKRGGRGIVIMKDNFIAGAQLVTDDDLILLVGDKNSLCLEAKDMPALTKIAQGNIVIKGNITSVSKV